MEKVLARRILFLALLVMPIIFLFVSLGFSESQQRKVWPHAKTIQEITLSTFPDAVQVDIKGDGPLSNYSVIRLSDPPRLVLDFPAMANASGKWDIQIGHELVNKIRIGQHPKKARVVFEFPGEKIPLNQISQIDKKEAALTLLFFRTKKQEPLTSNRGEERGGDEDWNQADVPTNQMHSYEGKKISLDLTDSDIRLVFQKIAEESHQNIVVSDDVQGKITLRLMDVPWDQALDVILGNRHLAKFREGNVLRIVTQEEYNQKRQ